MIISSSSSSAECIDALDLFRPMFPKTVLPVLKKLYLLVLRLIAGLSLANGSGLDGCESSFLAFVTDEGELLDEKHSNNRAVADFRVGVIGGEDISVP